jgi:predicted RecB family nuclease
LDIDKAVKETFQLCTTNSGSLPRTITGSTVYTYVVSPFNVSCDLFAPESERDPVPEYQKLLFQRGIDHERDVRTRMYPDAVPLKFTTKEEGFQLLLKSCYKGATALSNMPVFFLPENLYGEPDVLERNDSHESIFGKFHYAVKEIKLAKNIKREHIMEAAFNNYLIGKVQGFTPETFTIVNRDAEELLLPFTEHNDSLRTIVEDIAQIMKGKQVSPTVGNLSFPWENYGMKVAKRTKEISLIPDVGQMKKSKLLQVGITTLEDMANAEIGKMRISGISVKSLERWKLSAQMLLQNSHRVLEKPRLPIAKTEMFLDLEGTDVFVLEGSEVKADYLVGLVIRESNQEKYVSFFANNLNEEQQILQQFLNLVRAGKDFVIYHYSSYEKTRLKALFEKYGTSEALRTLVLDRMVDLLPVLKKCVVLPTYSYSLKPVAKLLGFSWRAEIGAQDSIVLYLKYLEDKDQKKREEIINYNEDDCRATVLVKDFLARLS